MMRNLLGGVVSLAAFAACERSRRSTSPRLDGPRSRRSLARMSTSRSRKVAITSPSGGSVVTGVINVQSHTYDLSGMQGVEF
jgi:hypothetical protein